MRLLLIGFGTVGQGLAELLIDKKSELKSLHSLDTKVVGISDMLKGSVYNADGIDLAKALEIAKSGGKLSEMDGAFDGDALGMINSA